MTTVASLIRARKGDQHAGYIFEGRTYTWDEVVSESAIRASILNDLLADGRPPHVGILLENTPEYLFWIGGAALVGACVVGINPTRRGSELERDIQHTDCQIIVSDQSGMTLIDGLQTGVDTNKVIDVDSAQHRDQLLQHRDATLPEHEPEENSILFLLFTSGSTSAPKAVVCTNQRMAIASVRAGQIYGVTSEEVCYCPMPLFHGNALMACWGPALAVGATVVLRRKFSASNFMSDIREHGCTYFTYVGRTIAYILGQPANADDKHNKLRLGFGTEASALDRERFFERFGCDLVEGYGSSESVVAIIRT
ncbi:MAG: AMP-binding protein, partial [Ilumatobacteraceae bacterium]|nr:AMP-binding protein [Ilumatobacteraceae bacterium]